MRIRKEILGVNWPGPKSKKQIYGLADCGEGRDAPNGRNFFSIGGLSGGPGHFHEIPVRMVPTRLVFFDLDGAPGPRTTSTSGIVCGDLDPCRPVVWDLIQFDGLPPHPFLASGVLHGFGALVFVGDHVRNARARSPRRPIELTPVSRINEQFLLNLVRILGPCQSHRAGGPCPRNPGFDPYLMTLSKPRADHPLRRSRDLTSGRGLSDILPREAPNAVLQHTGWPEVPLDAVRGRQQRRRNLLRSRMHQERKARVPHAFHWFPIGDPQDPPHRAKPGPQRTEGSMICRSAPGLPGAKKPSVCQQVNLTRAR